jgi:hypothetical protein
LQDGQAASRYGEQAVAAGSDVIRAEKTSGTRRDGRTELQVPLDFIRAVTFWW